ncbi:hypothetical protein CF319_g8851 [Tilletia indica]|nr:hypothetical protein CF319_g8851 [Tilletia indica]
MTLGPAPAALLQALEVTSPASDDRAERLRQARAANRLSAQQKEKTKEGPTAEDENNSADDNIKQLNTTPAVPSTPPPTQTRKRNRAE